MPHRVLIADDDRAVVSLVKLRLEMARFQVVAAADGTQALDHIHRHEPQAAILDVRMPRLSGLDVLAALKADPLTCRLPVMMLTGERDAGTVVEAMSGGADDYMVKPFNPDTLLARVARLVRNSSMNWSPQPAWDI